MTNKQIEAVADDLSEEMYADFEDWNKYPTDSISPAGASYRVNQRKPFYAGWMFGAKYVVQALKDAHPYITDDAVRARVGELITKVEG